jgi:hypothetical protein
MPQPIRARKAETARHGDLAVLPGGVPTERQIQRAILKMCGQSFPRVFIMAIPNGAQLAGNATSRFKQMGALKGDGLKVGAPDLLCLWAAGQGAFLECKRPKTGKLSEAQIDVHGRLAEIRWPVAVVTSPEAAFDFLKGLGAPWSGIPA